MGFAPPFRAAVVAAGLVASLLVATGGLLHFGGRLSLLDQVIGASHYFLAGVLAYEWRRRIVLSIPWGVAALVAWVAFSPGNLTYQPATVLFLGYALLVLCLHPALSLGDPLRGVDVSYGVYLYGFPVQQCVESVVKGSWLLNAGLSLLLVVPVALASWFLVEERALRLKWRVTPEKVVTPAALSDANATDSQLTQ